MLARVAAAIIVVQAATRNGLICSRIKVEASMLIHRFGCNRRRALTGTSNVARTVLRVDVAHGRNLRLLVGARRVQSIAALVAKHPDRGKLL